MGRYPSPILTHLPAAGPIPPLSRLPLPLLAFLAEGPFHSVRSNAGGLGFLLVGDGHNSNQLRAIIAGPVLLHSAAPPVQFRLLLSCPQFVHHFLRVDGVHGAAGLATKARRSLDRGHAHCCFLAAGRARDIHQGGWIDVVGHCGRLPDGAPKVNVLIISTGTRLAPKPSDGASFERSVSAIWLVVSLAP